MKTLITPLIENQTASFLMKEGFGKGDTLIVLVPEEKLKEGLNLGEEELNTLRDKIDDLGIDIKLEKKILDTQKIENLVREISRIFMNSEGEIVVNLSTENERLLIALTTSCTFHGDSIKTFYTQPSTSSYFENIEFPYLTADLKENEEKFLRLVVREGPMTINEFIETADFSHSKSTISRLSRILEEKGLVDTRLSGKEKEMNSTLAGDIVFTTL